ncbi:hypothetical protein [Vulcanisaeta sp. JCM 16159]|uniref:hypothetical protein n=1 Tax=Vulcanisaeta sp. JCM 16159 TaxID=1295371 RepID=UPI001FB31B7F|nr:hypothetical protein [Vulcanisaeta sp. JCM 16159]
MSVQGPPVLGTIGIVAVAIASSTAIPKCSLGFRCRYVDACLYSSSFVFFVYVWHHVYVAHTPQCLDHFP